jgi:hypothetical protein
VKQRNDDFRRINSELCIFNKFEFEDPEAKNVTDNFDLVFIMGDMNYRIDEEYDYIKECVNSNKLDKLRDRDQLLREAKNGIYELSRFSEGPIKFAPTYKYILGTDKLYYDGERLPGWTDRIL